MVAVGMHQFKPSVRPGPLRDPLERAIAEEFGRLIVELRLKSGLSRLVVVQRSGINWKRIRGLEEGRQAPCLHEILKLATLYGVGCGRLIETIIQPRARESGGLDSLPITTEHVLYSCEKYKR